jgi:ABC-type uncharacterized transport system substrate-binding protein
VRRREFICLLGCSFARPCVALAQQSAKQRKIGWLTPAPRNNPKAQEAFRQRLEDLGHLEGRDIAMVYRHADGNLDRLRSLAADLVEQKVDVIVTVSTPAAVAARNATSTIPIVMTSVSDPVRTGLVETLARPGRNVTGLSFSVGFDIFSKSIELLKEAVPSLQTVALLMNPTNLAHVAAASQIEAAAPALHVSVGVFQVRRVEELATTFEVIAQHRYGAVFVFGDPVFGSEPARIAKLTLQYQLPSIHQLRLEVEAGGLMSYGPDLVDLFRRAAGYVDAILKGAKPADLPVQQPTKFEFVINLNAARALGITISPTLVVRADEVIE